MPTKKKTIRGFLWELAKDAGRALWETTKYILALVLSMTAVLSVIGLIIIVVPSSWWTPIIVTCAYGLGTLFILMIVVIAYIETRDKWEEYFKE